MKTNENNNIQKQNKSKKNPKQIIQKRLQFQQQNNQKLNNYLVELQLNNIRSLQTQPQRQPKL